MIEGETGGRDVVLDLEAGLEHMSRGTPRYVDTLLAVVEPYFRSLEAGRRVVELAHELEVPAVYTVANKVRNQGDEDAIREFSERHDLDLIESIPYDDGFLDAERAGKAPIDHAPQPAAVVRVRELAHRLVGA